MAIKAEAVEIKRQAQVILTEFGTPLPGELQVLEQFGVMMNQLHEAELRRGHADWSKSVLRHLYLYLLHPGIFLEVTAHHPKDADPNEVFHADLYNHVLEYARTLPLRGVEVPVGRGRIAIWSSHSDVEEKICSAADAAKLGDLIPLPTLENMDGCSINFSSRRDSFWRVYPDGHIMFEQGNKPPIAANEHLGRVAKITLHATRYFSQMQPRSQD